MRLNKLIKPIIGLVFFLLPNFIYSNLIITEVFYDGSDEWIELYSMGENFSGNISLSGAKSSLINLTNIAISSGDFMIIGDTGDKIINKGNFIGGLGLSISDMQALNISLYSSGALLDTFYVSSKDILSLNDLFTSFEKVLSGNSFFITGTISSHIYNVSGNRIANPLKLSLLDIDSSTNIISGSTELSGSSSYSSGGDIYLTGYNGYISGENNLSGINNDSGINLSGIVNTGTIDTTLNTGNTLEDIPTIDKREYDFRTNCKIYSQKQYIGSGYYNLSLSINSGNQNYCNGYYNVKWYKDDIFFSDMKCSIDNILLVGDSRFDLYISSGDNALCSSSLLFSSNYNYIFTGGSCQNSNSGKLIVSEVNPVNGELNEYIELKAIGNYSGNIEIKGLGYGSSSKYINISISSGEYIILSSTYSGFITTGNVYIISGMSLTDSGKFLSIYGQSGQVFDTIDYAAGQKSKSLYFSGFSGDIRVFSLKNINSPLFDEVFLPYVSSSKCPVTIENDSSLNYGPTSSSSGSNTFNNCNIKIQNTTPFYFDNSINLIATISGTDIQNSNTKYVCEWNFGTGNFIAGCNPGYYKYGLGGVYVVNLKITNLSGESCSSVSYINYPSKAASTSVGSYYTDYMEYKTKYDSLKAANSCFSGEEKIDVPKVKFTSKSLSFVSSVLTGIVKIDSSVPNPKGTDKNNENISIRLLSGNILNLSGFLFNYGNYVYLLSGFISNETITLTGDFGLPNKASCIKLIKSNILYDIYCYDNKSNKIEYTGDFINLSGLNQLVTESYTGVSLSVEKISLGKISIYFSGLDACLKLQNDFKCKKVKLSGFDLIDKNYLKQLKYEIKSLSGSNKKLSKEKTSFEKKLLSIGKSSLKLEEKIKSLKNNIDESKESFKMRIKKYQDKVSSLSVENKTRINKYKVRVSKLNNDIKTLKQKIKIGKSDLKVQKLNMNSEMLLNKNYSKLITKEIKKNRSIVYYNSNLNKYEKIYARISRYAKKGQSYIDLYGEKVNIYDIEKIYDISTSLRPLTYRIIKFMEPLIHKYKFNFGKTIVAYTFKK